MLGQCYEKLKRPDKQLLAYQRSLQLDNKQADLLVEVCKLLQNNELPGVSPAKARYWYELADSRNLKIDGAAGKNAANTSVGSGKGKGSRKKQQQSQHHNYRHETAAHNLSDSFVSANGRSDLDDSSSAAISSGRTNHDANATPQPQYNFSNIERLCRQMMESLTILKEDVAEVRNRVQNIEEQLNERGIGDGDDDDEDDSVDVEDGLDFMDDFRDVKRNQQHNLNNTSMMANVSSRNHTINQQTPKSMHSSKPQQQQQAVPPMSVYHGAQGAMQMQNPLLFPPMMYGQFGAMNPYQAAMALHQQQLMMGLLQSPQQQQQQLPIQSIANSYAMQNPMVAVTVASPFATNTMTSASAAQPKFDMNAGFQQMTTQTPPPPVSKQWNPLINNAPVEKGKLLMTNRFIQFEFYTFPS